MKTQNTKVIKIDKEKVKNNVTNSLIPKPGYVLIQCVMFFLHYGLKYTMPWWVVWFPTIMFVTIIVGLLIFLLGVIIIAAIAD